MTDIFNSIYVVSETVETIKKAQDRFDTWDYIATHPSDEIDVSQDASFWADYLAQSEDDDLQY